MTFGRGIRAVAVVLVATLAGCTTAEQGFRASLREWYATTDRDAQAAHRDLLANRIEHRDYAGTGNPPPGLRLGFAYHCAAFEEFDTAAAALTDERRDYPSAAPFLAFAAARLEFGGVAASPAAVESSAPESGSAAPRVVLIVPSLVPAPQRAIAVRLDTAMQWPLAERGYYAVPVEVGVALLSSLGWTPQDHDVIELPRERLAEHGVDALLVTRVVEWPPLLELEDGRERSAPGRYAIEWLVIDAASGETLLSRSRSGTLGEEARVVLSGPFLEPDDPVLGRDRIDWIHAEREDIDPDAPSLMQIDFATSLPLGPLHPDGTPTAWDELRDDASSPGETSDR